MKESKARQTLPPHGTFPSSVSCSPALLVFLIFMFLEPKLQILPLSRRASAGTSGPARQEVGQLAVVVVVGGAVWWREWC